jgi:cytochrome c556
MNWRRLSESFLGIAVAGAIVTSGVTAKGDEAFKEAMRKARDSLQPMLVDLVNGDYEAVVNDVGPIIEHAARLPEMIPDSAKPNEGDFLAYSHNLQENAKILKSLLETVVRGEDEAAKQAGLKTEYLSVVAATHFGGMVNMCVACHSRFRIPIEK